MVPGHTAITWKSQDLNSSYNFTPLSLLSDSLASDSDAVRIQKHDHTSTSLVSTKFEKVGSQAPNFLPHFPHNS